MSGANLNKFKEFLSKLWELINLILILILIFSFFVNTGPAFRGGLLLDPYLFDTQHLFLLKTDCIAWDTWNSEDIEISSILQIVQEPSEVHCTCISIG